MRKSDGENASKLSILNKHLGILISAHSHESIFSLALFQGPVNDWRESPEECVLLRLGLGAGALHLGVLLGKLHRLAVTWEGTKKMNENGMFSLDEIKSMS
jgi:hypothetical protein